MPSTKTGYPTQIDALTSLRYIAAAWVVIFHLKEYTRSEFLNSASIFTFGYLGVDFFFVLSGFVLTHVYKKSIDQLRFDYWGFVLKRLGRIYPMHLFTLVLFLILGAASAVLHISYQNWNPSIPFVALDRGELIRAIVAHLTLIHAWGSTNDLRFNLPSWSISAEWFAYLLFPAYMLLFKLVRLPAWVMVVLSTLVFLGMAAASAVLMGAELTKMSWNIGILRIFPEFLLGAALYVLGERWSAGATGARVGLVVGVLVALGGIAFGAYAPGLRAAGAALAVLGLACVIFFAADGDRYGIFPWLSRPFFVLLGEISYSVYMLHLLVAMILFELVFAGYRPAGTIEGLAAIAGALALTTVLSWVTYKLIEVPGRDAVVRFGRNLNRPSETLGATPRP